MFKELEEKRSEWAAAGAGMLAFFRMTVVPGDVEKKAEKGKDPGSVKAFASGRVAEDWCIQYHLYRSASFQFSVYGGGKHPSWRGLGATR